MKLLSINSGSSSLKFKLYEMPSEEVILYGYIDKIGLDTEIKVIIKDETKKEEKPLKNHEEAVECLINILLENNVVESLDEIKAIGHRIVNGGGRHEPEEIDDELIKNLESITSLSKVHMPGHISGIKAFKKLLPDIKQTVVYDTAFHYTLPEENYLYPVPYEWYTKYGIRKFGFHGTSCEYITLEMEKILNKKPNLIICHIGNGASVTLVQDGKSVDTSMGFTANAGVIMGTRCGDIDYSIIPYIMEETGKDIKEIDDILNKKSGLFGIAGVSDNRDIENMVANNEKQGILANKMYVNKVLDYIGKYYLEARAIDALVFCGGVGENGIKFREEVIDKLEKLNIHLNKEMNDKIAKFKDVNTGIITTDDSSIPCYVIPTDEEVMIARHTYELIK